VKSRDNSSSDGVAERPTAEDTSIACKKNILRNFMAFLFFFDKRYMISQRQAENPEAILNRIAIKQRERNHQKLNTKAYKKPKLQSSNKNLKASPIRESRGYPEQNSNPHTNPCSKL
jgi:hypothetical protein